MAVASRRYNISLNCTVMVLKTEEPFQLIECVSLRCERSREKMIEYGGVEGEKWVYLILVRWRFRARKRAGNFSKSRFVSSSGLVENG